MRAHHSNTLVTDWIRVFDTSFFFPHRSMWIIARDAPQLLVRRSSVFIPFRMVICEQLLGGVEWYPEFRVAGRMAVAANLWVGYLHRGAGIMTPFTLNTA